MNCRGSRQRRLTMGISLCRCVRSSRQSFHVAFFGKVIEQEMEVNQSAVIFSIGQDSPHTFVIQILAQPQPTCQVIASSHIIARKDVPSPQTSQKNIFSGPSSHSSQFLQIGQRCVIRKPRLTTPDRVVHRRLHWPIQSCARTFCRLNPSRAIDVGIAVGPNPADEEKRGLLCRFLPMQVRTFPPGG